MAKLGKDELISKVNEKVLDQDTAIELIEDITDSFLVEDNSEKELLKAEIDNTKAELEALKTKYKERFLSSEPVTHEVNTFTDEPHEDNVIDIKEIF